MPLEGVDIRDEEIDFLSAGVGDRPAGIDLGRQTASKADHRDPLLLF
jgi:hypothetical protein